MTDIVIDQPLLVRLAARNNFTLPEEDLIFFGIRGALPLDISGTPFAGRHQVRTADFDHLHMRCTLGQFRPSTGELAVFPGSTVPSLSNVRAARLRGGAGANMLMLGKYRYERGVHKLGRPSGHRAFRQAEFFPVWRSSDDLDFDLADRPDLDGDFVFDNLHCAFHDNLDTPGFSSAGCQVVCGHPRSPARGNRPETGPWKRFVENAYGAPGGQTRYTYMLFTAAEVAMVAAKPDSELNQSARFGSSGDLVRAVQAALIAEGMELDPPDGRFGRDTIEALMAFQSREFGAGKADGIVGANTAQALGIALPRLAAATSEAPAGPADLRVSIDAVERLGEEEAEPHRIEVIRDDQAWSARVDGGDPFYVGSSVRFGSFRGIFQPAGRLPSLPGGRFKPEDWAARLGDRGAWAWFLAPTVMAESGGLFARVNTYDGAGLTFGAFQFASHTPNDNLILLFRALMALPDAGRWFPDLALVGGKLHRRTSNGTASLENAGANGRLVDFMEYLNPDAATVSRREVENAARLIGWMLASDAVETAQVELAIRRFAQRVNRLGTAHGVDLGSVPVAQLVWVADILHHGRGTYRKIKEAINGPNPERALAAIGAGDPRWADRIATVKTQVAAVKPKLAREKWGQGAFDV